MKKFLLGLLFAVMVVGCSSKENTQNVEAKLVVGKSLSTMQLKDQHEVLKSIDNNTKIVFFSFSKPIGHTCNEFLSSKEPDFLQKHNAVYVADVSPAPSIIKNMLILPDLKKLKFTILLINDDILSAQFSKDMNKDTIVVAFLENKKIVKIKNLKTKDDLENLFK